MENKEINIMLILIMFFNYLFYQYNQFQHHIRINNVILFFKLIR
jgi:hypothetical protein